MAQPQVAKHGIVALLVEEQLPIKPKTHVHLAEFIDVWGVAEGAGAAREVEYGAFADVDEETDVLLASGR